MKDKINKEEMNKKFEEYFDLYNDVIYRLCLFKTSSEDVARDLTQDVFTKFFVYINQKPEPKNVKSFLYQMARNRIIDHYRKHKSDSLDVLEESGPGFAEESYGHEQTLNQAEYQIAIEAIKKLDEKYRDVLFMSLVEDYSIEEISENLNISKSNVSVRLNRGKKQLSNILKI